MKKAFKGFILDSEWRGSYELFLLFDFHPKAGFIGIQCRGGDAATTRVANQSCNDQEEQRFSAEEYHKGNSERMCSVA